MTRKQRQLAPIVVMSSKPKLKLDWCSHEAAKYAVEKWHYSKSLPVPPIVRIGVWEDEIFIGCVLFSRGASTNLLKPYGLSNVDGCELTRVALNKHRTPVTKIMSVATRMVRKINKGLRLIVSYADPMQNHHGGIYQASNWIYTGTTSPDRAYLDSNGKRYHSRVIAEHGSGYRKQFGVMRKCMSSKGMKKIITAGKHRYLMPLDDEIRKRIEPLRKPYPKRATSIAGDALADQAREGGSTPTVALSN